MTHYDYQPYYCEENVWKLCDRGVPADARVIFISNPPKQVLLLEQRAGEPDHGLVVWDYHVIFAEPDKDGWLIRDLDTRLGNPCLWTTYREKTFPQLAESHQHWAPLFRVVPALDFHEQFSSDRSHMQTDSGDWLQPPPPWPPISNQGDGTNLSQFVDMQSRLIGEVVRIDSLLL